MGITIIALLPVLQFLGLWRFNPSRLTHFRLEISANIRHLQDLASKNSKHRKRRFASLSSHKYKLLRDLCQALIQTYALIKLMPFLYLVWGFFWVFFESFSQTNFGRVDSKSKKGKSQKCKWRQKTQFVSSGCPQPPSLPSSKGKKTSTTSQALPKCSDICGLQQVETPHNVKNFSQKEMINL